MAFKFENLNVWQKALDLTIQIDKVARLFPKFEVFNLSNQIRKASDSVVLNIAEGCTGQSAGEFRKFLGYALRSAIEVVSCLFIARRKDYIDDRSFATYYEGYETLCKMITRLRDTVA